MQTAAQLHTLPFPLQLTPLLPKTIVFNSRTQPRPKIECVTRLGGGTIAKPGPLILYKIALYNVLNAYLTMSMPA